MFCYNSHRVNIFSISYDSNFTKKYFQIHFSTFRAQIIACPPSACSICFSDAHQR